MGEKWRMGGGGGGGLNGEGWGEGKSGIEGDARIRTIMNQKQKI